ncbi:MAG: RHS repeat protein, partial [Verrucomicrobia bacterium]|nr:RHS repeat protein [Verrucomicrobiota bacterium]
MFPNRPRQAAQQETQLSETYSGGPLAGLAVTNGYDTRLRRTKLALLSGSTVLQSTDYSYHSSSGRLETVSDGTHSAQYDYLANSGLVEEIEFKHNSSPRMTSTQSYDKLNRLTAVESTSSSFSSSFAYQYNQANQRTAVTNADGSYWVYEYDPLGQVTSGKRYWSDDTLVAGQQFEYGFDDIGNRKFGKSGGDPSGANLRTIPYQADLLNQYHFRASLGYVDVMGEADENATVTVNLKPTVRNGAYWWGEAQGANGTGPVWLAITNVAVLADEPNPHIVATNLGHVFVPAGMEYFSYDTDGNLTGDGRWSYAWDAENRVRTFTRIASAPAAARVKLDCQYDAQSRRTEKVVSTWVGSGYAAQSTRRFV